VGDIFDDIAAQAVGGAPPSGPDIFDQIAAQAVTAGPQAAAEEPVSWRSAIMGGLKGIAKFGSDVVTAPADLIYRGGNAAIDLVTGQDTDLAGGYPSDYRDSFVDFVSGGEGDKVTEDQSRLVGNLATVIGAPSQAKNIAANIPLVSRVAQGGGTGSTLAKLLSSAIGYGTEGAGYSALFNAKSDNLGEDMAEGAAINIAIPAAFSAAGSLAKGLKSGTSEAARKLELSAYGGNQALIRKAYEKSPEILDDFGTQKNPLTLALNSFRKEGGGAGSMEGKDLLKELYSQESNFAKSLGSELRSATAKQKNAIVPEFKYTREYIAGLPGVAKEEAQLIADELIPKTINNTDGTLLSLQAEKTGLRQVIKDSAYGTTQNPIKTEVLKRIRGDLRRTIEESYESITGKSGDKIRKLNEEIAHRENLEPLFENLRNSGEGRTVLSSGLQSLRTSGGVGQLIIAGAAGMGAGGLPAGVAAVGANMYLQSPAGKRALANGLRSSIVQAPIQGTIQGAKIGPLLGKVLAGTQPSETTQEAEASQASALLAPPLSSTAKQTRSLKAESLPSLNPTASSGATQGDYSFMNTLFKGDKLKPSEAQVLEEIKKDPVDHAIAIMESGKKDKETGQWVLDPKAKNPESSASGLFQLIKKTAGDLGVKDVFNPKDNYEGYKKLKAETIEKFGASDPFTIYASHYLGETTLRKVLDGKSLSEKERKQVQYLKTVLFPKLEKIYNGLTQESGVVEA